MEDILQYFNYNEGEDYVQITEVKDTKKLPAELTLPSHYNRKQLYLPNNCSELFADCSTLQSIDLSDITDTSNVTDMSLMFYNCTYLKYINFGSFDTSNVTSMYMTFAFCKKLKYLDLAGFDTSKVIYMVQMFMDCSDLRALHLATFNTFNLRQMYMMFYGCEKLRELDLAGFDISNVVTLDGLFDNCPELITTNNPELDAFLQRKE